MHWKKGRYPLPYLRFDIDDFIDSQRFELSKVMSPRVNAYGFGYLSALFESVF